MKLPPQLYTDHDAIELAALLLGKKITTRFGGQTTSGMIVETEAYMGVNDRASHSFGGRRTPRNEAMYSEGGIAYVYLCYGIHHLFNVVCNRVEVPQAVLIRAIEPLEGVEVMLHRRKMGVLTFKVCAGPGALSQALGITTAHNGTSLQGDIIALYQYKDIEDKFIFRSKRIGVAYAGADALLPYRFSIANHPWCSPAK